MIRLIEESDIEQAVLLVKSFYEESLKLYGFSYNDETLIAIAKEHCVNKSALVMIEDSKIVGVIAGKFVLFPASDYKVFQETIWYVLPEHRKHGLKLFRETENYCKSIGIKTMIMSNMENLNSEKMAIFYKSQGYKPLEVQWVKML